jgi:hypothetical protein
MILVRLLINLAISSVELGINVDLGVLVRLNVCQGHISRIRDRLTVCNVLEGFTAILGLLLPNNARLVTDVRQGRLMEPKLAVRMAFINNL